MKKYLSISIITTLLLSVVVYSCNINDKEAINKEELLDFIAKKEDVLKMSKFFTEKNEWILTEVDFLKVEDDSEVVIGKNEIDGLLVFEYYNSKDKDFFKTGYFRFKKDTLTGSYILIGGIAQSCSGVNCSRCKLEDIWMEASYCSCKKIGDIKAGPSYCNHSTGVFSNLKDLTTSKQIISNLIIDNPKIIIQEVNKVINLR